MAVAPRQHAVVRHRVNFWARQGAPSHEYRGAAAWEVERPDDGEPAVRHRVRCAVCTRELTFTVHGVAATAARRGRWRWGTRACFAVLALGVVVVATAFAGENTGLAVGGTALAAAGVLGAVLAWAGGLAEVGITGHGNGVPGLLPAHAVVLGRRPPA